MTAPHDAFRPDRRDRSILPLAGVVLFNGALWGWTIGYEFVFDDLVNVLANPWIRDWRAVPAAFAQHAAGFDPRFETNFYRPFMHVFYAVAYSIAGTSPWAYHLLNVAFQVLAAISVYHLSVLLCRRWACPERCAALPLVSALVFSAHPIHTEAVAWTAGITDLSYTAFALLALIAYIRAYGRTFSPWPGALLLASLLSKETGAVALLLMLVFEWIESGRDRLWSIGAAARRLGAPVLCACIYLGMRLAALGSLMPGAGRQPHTAADLVAVGAGLFARDLGALVWPVNLNVMRLAPVDQGFSDPAASIGLLLGCALAVLVVRYRRDPFVAMSIAVVALPILPTLYVPAIEGGGSVFGERYLYLPVLGIAWCVGRLAGVFARPSGRTRSITFALVGLLLCWYSAAAAVRSRAWANSLDLWTDAARKSERSAAAQEGLCHALYTAGRIPEALSACERAIAIDATRTDARINRANALLALRRPAEALRELDVAIGLRFDSAHAHTARGLACMALGRLDEALASYRQALAINPDLAEAHNDLGVALVYAARPAEARIHFEHAVRLAPSSPEYRSNLQACPRQ